MNNNGGPAFPCSVGAGGKLFNPGMNGMTLRDYFATAALNVLNPEVGMGWLEEAIKRQARELARASYSIADAMLKEREKDS